MNKLYLIVIALLSCFYMHAQVTIGLDEVPNKGALLDLKERNNPVGNEGEANSSRGLGLPRAELIHKYELTMGTNVIADAPITGGGTIWEAHTGLVVYNVKPAEYNPKTCRTEGLSYGLHVWDGAAWQELGYKEEKGGQNKGSQDVRTVTDDGSKITLSYKDETTEYRYSSFGAAGTWMTENMATKYLPDGTLLEKSVSNEDSKPRYIIPGGGSEITGKEGLLYNWTAATYSRTCKGINQSHDGAGSTTPGPNEVESLEESSPGAKDGKIQGICPAGWHLPSDREWNELEKEITTNASLYTQTPMSNGTWNSAWETESVSPRGTHGAAMKSNTSVNGVNPAGDSKSAGSGGFDILLVGYHSVTTAFDYGKSAYLWSSSGGRNGLYYSWCRLVNSDKQGVDKTNVVGNVLRSVRCKKD